MGTYLSTRHHSDLKAAGSMIEKTMKFSLVFAIVGISLTSAKVLDIDLDLREIYENVKNQMETQLRSADGYKFTGHTWKAKKDYPSEMSKRNKIFRNLHAHLKNEFDLNDATARTFAKRALSEFRSSGSKAITRTSPLCTDELPPVTCVKSSKFRTIEGLCNNLGSPYFGAFDTKFIREIEVDPYDAKAITISDPASLGIARLQNILSDDCYFSCDKQPGPCTHCGSEGLCCRQGRVEKGCDGETGGRNRHECVPPGGELPPLLNILADDCYKWCGRKSGQCDHCGSEGLCCRQGNIFAEEGCDGVTGGPNRHECVPPPNNNKNGNNGCGWRDTLPSARTVSHLFFTNMSVPSPALTHMVTQFGQFLDHDVTGTPEFHSPDNCCAVPDAEECINISVGAGLDSFYNPFNVDCLSLHRSEPFCEENEESGVTREHFNINTHFVDQSNVYGHSDETADSLRTYEDGLLKVLEDEDSNDLLPEAENDDGEIVEFAGDFRAREMPGLLSMHTLFVREHNRIAGLIKVEQPNWSDEDIYQNARRINAGAYQSIVYGGFLPIVLGKNNIDGLEVTQDGTDYDNAVDPSMTTEFATAAFRFGHSMIQGLVERFNTDNSGLFDTYLLHDVFFVSDNLKTISTSGQLGMEQIIMGLITQPAQSMDKEMTEEITNLLFAGAGADFGGDLMARNIQRGRDHGIPGFCCYYQLHVDSNFDCDKGWNNKYKGISQDNWNLLRTIHTRPSDIDLWTGGLAQDSFNGGLTGQVLQQMKYNAFLKAKNGDRFFFTHKDQAGSFTSQGRQILINRTLAGVICDNTKITFVPENAFELTDPEDFISCDGAPKIDQENISVLLQTE